MKMLPVSRNLGMFTVVVIGWDGYLGSQVQMHAAFTEVKMDHWIMMYLIVDLYRVHSSPDEKKNGDGVAFIVRIDVSRLCTQQAY